MLSVANYHQTRVPEALLENICPNDQAEREQVAFPFQLFYSKRCFEVVARYHAELVDDYPLVVSALQDELYHIYGKVEKLRISHRGQSRCTIQGPDGQDVHDFYDKVTEGFSVRDYALCEALFDGDYARAMTVYLSAFAAFRFENHNINGRTMLSPWTSGAPLGAAEQAERIHSAKTKAKEAISNQNTINCLLKYWSRRDDWLKNDLGMALLKDKICRKNDWKTCASKIGTEFGWFLDIDGEQFAILQDEEKLAILESGLLRYGDATNHPDPDFKKYGSVAQGPLQRKLRIFKSQTAKKSNKNKKVKLSHTFWGDRPVVILQEIPDSWRPETVNVLGIARSDPNSYHKILEIKPAIQKVALQGPSVQMPIRGGNPGGASKLKRKASEAEIAAETAAETATETAAETIAEAEQAVRTMILPIRKKQKH